MQRKCAICGGIIMIDKDNSHKIIHYKNKFYHFACFDNLCDQKMTHTRRDIAEMWRHNKVMIAELVEATTKEQRSLVDRDEFNQWLKQQYNLSSMSKALYVILDSVYKGTYSGLVYPISPLELHNEWQYYWTEMCAIRQTKGLIGELAIRYDLAVVLGRNAEYRKMKEKEKLAREIQKQQRENENIMNIRPQIKPKKQPKVKIADLYKDIYGDENNE